MISFFREEPENLHSAERKLTSRSCIRIRLKACLCKMYRNAGIPLVQNTGIPENHASHGKRYSFKLNKETGEGNGSNQISYERLLIEPRLTAYLLMERQ